MIKITILNLDVQGKLNFLFGKCRDSFALFKSPSFKMTDATLCEHLFIWNSRFKSI